MRLRGILIIVALLGILLFLNGCGNQTPKEETTKSNCREVQTPYETTETYTEQVQYVENVEKEIQHTVVTSRGYNCGSLLNVIACLDVFIENTDNVGGEWTVNCKFVGSNFEYKDSVSQYIQPKQKATLTCKADASSKQYDVGNWSLGDSAILVPKVTVPETKTKTVTKTKPVVKYKTETKCD